MRHQHFLQQALILAQTRRGFCAPNPAVGAVLVKDNRVLAAGLHWQAGEPHAEVKALENSNAKDATLYVTLEPCCHWGRTPPCVDLIIQSGIKAVYFGLLDPNPQVAGLGKQRLQQAGIVCEQLFMPAIEEFYRSYCHWWHTKTPWITAKLAITLDGKIAYQNRQPAKISGLIANQFTHAQRRQHDAILTSIATILADDPQFNVRLGNSIISKTVFILDAQLQFPLASRLKKSTQKIILFHSKQAPEKNRLALIHAGVQCIEVNAEMNVLDLNQIINIIGEQGVHDLWVEVGARCLNSLIAQQRLNQLILYVAPHTLGEQGMAGFLQPLALIHQAKLLQVSSLGIDTCFNMVFSAN